MITNFAALTTEQKVVWMRDVYSEARDMMFVNNFMGTSANNMIQKITALTKTEKGEEALMFLVADLVGDGTVGDNQREGNEEEMKSYNAKIRIDLISNQVKNKGKMADQRTVIRFRLQGRDKLAYWLANRTDQLVFLTMSGISYAYYNNGAPRINSQFPDLAFADDVMAPSPSRHVNWNGNELEAGDTSVITTAYTPSYKMLVQIAAYAKNHYIKPLLAGGKEYYMLLVQPGTLAMLKQDPDYLKAIITAMPRSAKNPFFTGGTVTVDGLVLHEHRLVYNTSGAAIGQKWGAAGDVNGTRTLCCGAQALGMVDLGPPEWVEKGFDYETKQGISIDKMLGLLKPQFHSIYDKSIEDFGLLAVNHYLNFI